MTEDAVKDDFQEHFRPIGFLESWFKCKNGTPRQPTVCSLARGKITILKSVFTNPDHALQGLSEYSHVWLLFLFHKNSPRHSYKAKVMPPRLNGCRTGVFSTRSPHRPNPIGLTLARLDAVTGSTIHVSGIDILNGTPILDIKPFIPTYDIPTVPTLTEPVGEPKELASELQLQEPPIQRDINIISAQVSPRSLPKCEERAATVAPWLVSPPVLELKVIFTLRAEQQLNLFRCDSPDPAHVLIFLRDATEAKAAIEDILKSDPRSVYRRTQCQDRLYYCTVDQMHVTCWFDDDDTTVEVLKIKPVSLSQMES